MAISARARGQLGAFADEAAHGLRALADVRVQELDGGAVAVAVRRAVDGGHAPHAEERVELPLVAEHFPDAVTRRGRELVCVRHDLASA